MSAPSPPPEVSVVLGVYNGAGVLSETLDSVVSQTGVPFEVIVVDDGSTDASGAILAQYAARDPRVRVLSQPNQGLTLALMRGCAEARGTYIARQDAGDVSFPDRLAIQAAQLSANPAAAMTSSGTRIVGPRGEHLYDVILQPGEFQAALEGLDTRRELGPSHHGATMFRRAAYLSAGGYRSAFRVSQDIDLWTRMVEVGACLSFPEVLYQAKMIEGSITGRRRRLQARTVDRIAACTRARRAGGSDAELVGDWARAGGQARGIADWRPDAMTAAEFNYFVGSMLRDRHPEQARDYYRRALAHWPVHLRSWVGLLRARQRVPGASPA